MCPSGCGKSYKHKRSIQRHSRHCGKEITHTCFVCHKNFKNVDDMTKHLFTDHQFVGNVSVLPL